MDLLKHQFLYGFWIVVATAMAVVIIALEKLAHRLDPSLCSARTLKTLLNGSPKGL